MQHSRPRLTRWLLKVQNFNFTVNYVPGDDPQLTVPDALIRYTFDASLIHCTRCLAVVGEIQKNGWGLQTMISAQTEECGDLEQKAASESQLLVNKEKK